MFRRLVWATLVATAVTGCNRSGSGMPESVAARDDAIKALKAVDADIDPSEPTADQPVTSIALNGEKINDDTMSYVARFPKLKELRLRNTAVTAAGIAKLRGLVTIEKLDLRDSKKIDDEALGGIAHLAGMKELRLNNTAVTDAGMAHVGRLTGLRVLYLSDTAVGDAGLAKLKRLSELGELELNRTKVTDAGLDQLNPLPSLKSVYLTGTAVTIVGIDKLKREKPDLKVTQ